MAEIDYNYNPFKVIQEEITSMNKVLNGLAETMQELELKTSAPMTLKQAAKFLQMGERTVRGYVANEAIPFHKVGAKILFYQEELNDWIKGNQKT